MKNEILELFNVMVIDGDRIVDEADTSLIDRGLITNFVPSNSEARDLKSFNRPLNIKTLFTREERDNGDINDLITIQLSHYLEVYGLGMPGLFDLEVTSGTIIKMNLIRGVTASEFGVMVQNLLYSNAPVDDAGVIAEIIKEYDIHFDINLVLNNELRVRLYNVDQHAFTSGDDAVRYMAYLGTGETMLIKSDEVIDAVRTAKIPKSFFKIHDVALAQVFNRHKRLIMAAKNRDNRGYINKISRWSKTRHVPIKEAINKTFVAKALADDKFDLAVLSKIGVRDKFKFLNLLAYKREGQSTDAFIIRNGKIHIEMDRKVWSKEDIDRVEEAVMASLQADLEHLKGKNILLDGKVRYGLPISRKQAMGRLPYGTRIRSDTPRISSGMYWHNDGGASDLDLSTVDTDGVRTGWGHARGYEKHSPVTFSGDITDAWDGAMEFMTSEEPSYGLFINIFSGNVGCEAELVVGNDSSKSKWIGDVLIREKIVLSSRGSVVGFVKNNEFTVFAGRTSKSSVSTGGVDPVVTRGMSEFWNVNDLFDMIGIDYDVDKSSEKVYAYDLTYEGFTFDKIEELLLK